VRTSVEELSYDEWLKTIPARLKTDPLWDSAYYRLAMYFYDLVWQDCEYLKPDHRGQEILRQLIRSSGGICANMEEAYGRGVGTPDHIRVLRIALGEARETQGWYVRSRHLLPSDKLDRRLDLVNQVISLTVKTISIQRRNLVRS
jgi:four helix bundle protein